jgi:hypothetical protein
MHLREAHEVDSAVLQQLLHDYYEHVAIWAEFYLEDASKSKSSQVGPYKRENIQ